MDVADRMCTSPSNLVNRIKGNPTISTVEDIAAALNISVSELLTKKPEKAQGVAFIGGQTYQLSLPSKNAVQLPIYDRYDDLRDDLKEFVKSSAKKDQDACIVAMLESFEVFSLYYDHHNGKFLLSICYGSGKTLAISFDKMEYADWKEGDTEETVKYDLADMAQEIINDIEGAALSRLSAE